MTIARANCLVVLVACASLLAPTDYGSAQQMTSTQDIEQGHLIDMDGISDWLKARFSEVELGGLPTGELSIEPYYCGCYDHPHKHFPQAVVMLRTPRGDLIARPEGGDQIVRFTPLAVRFGNLYCEVGSEQSCYGTFRHPCDFTDFRYGSFLAPFFPTCMSDEAETAAAIAFDSFRFGP
jgi:hypothetical protein